MRNVLVTGASRGLGLAISQRLVNDGFRVIGVARHATREFDELVAPSKRGDGQAIFRVEDLSATVNAHTFVRTVVAEFGPLYGLVNNAATGRDGVLATMHEKDISDIIHLNVVAPIVLTKYAVRSMLTQGRGRVINIASVIAFSGFNGLSVYGASKTAMVGFTKSLARELGKANITVNCIAPGYMSTEMTRALDAEKLETIRRRSPLGRLVTPADVAEAAGFLMNDASASITGTTITVDAGALA